MPKKKLKRMKALPSFETVVQHPEKYRGTWNKNYFKNNNKITLELACGKGDYTIALAEKYPGQNFIGIDLKGARLYIGAQKAQNQNLKNAAFINTNIQNLADIFGPEEISEIWIPFPDPYPKVSKAGKRLVSHGYLALYQQIIDKDCHIHFKTDDDPLFRYALASIESFHGEIVHSLKDIYEQQLENENITVQTTYEKRHLQSGKKIKYICFTLKKI